MFDMGTQSVTLFTGSGSLPGGHIYAFVDMEFISHQTGFEPVVWFGLTSYPGRAWGCHVMLECGAVYRNVPPHALAFSDVPDTHWPIQAAQLWDCYGYQFTTIEYEYLRGLEARTAAGQLAEYLFTVAPLADGFTRAPEQSKEFMFLRTRGDRLTIQPTNKVRFIDRSFTIDQPVPALKLQTEIWSCEGAR